MNALILKYSHKNGVKYFFNLIKFLYLLLIKIKKFPIKENLFEGAPHESLFSYSYAKGVWKTVQIDAYNKKFKTNYNYIIPCEEI